MIAINTSRSVAAQNTFTPAIRFGGPSWAFSVSGTWVGTLEIQQRPCTAAGTETWRTVKQLTENTDEMQSVEVIEGFEVRIGFPTGSYTSGAAVIVTQGNDVTGVGA